LSLGYNRWYADHVKTENKIAINVKQKKNQIMMITEQKTIENI